MKSTYEKLEAQLASAISGHRVWETTMMAACGEDGPKSVADKFAELEAQVKQLAAENALLKDVFGPGDSVLNFLAIALRHTTYDQIDLDDVTLAFKMSLPETPATDAYLSQLRNEALAEGVEMLVDRRLVAARLAKDAGNEKVAQEMEGEAIRARFFAKELREGKAGEVL